MKRLALVVLFLSACAPSTVYLIHPETQEGRACDPAQWHPESEGCISSLCIEPLAMRQWIRNCVARERNAGYITAEEWQERQERKEATP